MRALFPLVFTLAAAAADFEPASLIRLHPMGGQAGTEVEIEILGTRLDGTTGVEFDCADLEWLRFTKRETGVVAGVLRIAPAAAPGGHMLRVMTALGPTSSLLFNVGRYPALVEEKGREVRQLPVEIYGRLDGAADIDVYRFPVKAGERWVFDLRAMEHGSAVESRMMLLDPKGVRIAYNDDRNHYDENPLIEHVFAQDGIHTVKLDQYRGPRGFTFGKNNAYVLRISALPVIRSINPLGARRGSVTRFTIQGSGLADAKRAYLTQARRGDYARMTYPYTMPVRFEPDPAHGSEVPRIEGRVTGRTAEFAIPAQAAAGLWRLWINGDAGAAEGPSVEIGELPEFNEGDPAALRESAYSINGVLSAPRERDVHQVMGHAGEPLHVWTLSAQLGGPQLDTVLLLRSKDGSKLSEDDDVVAGWGGLLGNPDSSLFYTPKQDGPLLLEVRDRLNRGGPDYAYRLKVERRAPGFQLFTTPENFVVKKGTESVIKVHLVRESGFTDEVEVRMEGLPAEMTPPKHTFRRDQLFEPNADGADMIIPEIALRVRGDLPPGVHRIRILGKAPGGAAAQAHTATMIGPIYHGDWNFYRRPVPGLTLTVVE
ncbi:MAG: hypothetical protein FJW39_07390 [Acidobacteria bacterium]|nr:hypothetical protein [Acidobacteriota bacterium]